MKKVYRTKDKEYQEWYQFFIERFNKILTPYSPNDFDIDKVFRKKIRKIKFKKDGKDHPSSSYYDSLTKTLEINCDPSSDSHVKTHETMHGISAIEKRRSFLKTIYKLLSKRHNDFMLEEGLTEYLTNFFEGNNRMVNVLLSPYSNEAILSSLLFKIIDPKIILAFYFKNDKRFIQEIDKVFPGGYCGLLKVYKQRLVFRNRLFSEPYYYKKENMINTNVMFETFKKVKMLPNDSLANFEKNAALIIYFYREVFYAIKHSILMNEKRLKMNTSQHLEISQESVDYYHNKFKERFLDFKNTVLRPEWEQLGNNDDHLFEEIVMESIETQLDPDTFDVISKHGIFGSNGSQDGQMSNGDSTNTLNDLNLEIKNQSEDIIESAPMLLQETEGIEVEQETKERTR